MLFSNFFKKISVLYKRKSDALNYNKCVRLKLILCGLCFFLLAFNKEDNKERDSRENEKYYDQGVQPFILSLLGSEVADCTALLCCD